MQQLAGADAIVLTTPAGAPVADTRLPEATTEFVNLSPTILNRLRSGEPTYTVKGAIGSNDWPQAAVSVPVRRDGGLQFALIAGLQRARFQPLLTGQGLPEGWISSIVDDRGVILARVPNAQRLVGLSVRQPLQAAVARNQRGAFESHTVDGIAVVTAYIRSPVHGWTSMVAVPRSLLYAPLRRSAAYQALTAIVLLTLTMLLSLRMARRFISSAGQRQAKA